jgi:hypothetical protein
MFQSLVLFLQGDFSPASKDRIPNTMNTITTANKLLAANLTATEAGALLNVAAKAASEGKQQVDTGRAKGAAALAVLTAGFSCDDVMLRDWSFDIVGNDGQVKYNVDCTGWSEFGSEGQDWRSEPKKAQSAYKAAFVSQFLGLADCTPAIWTMTTKALVMAKAITTENMNATIENGKLKLTGGNTERAIAMAAAKSLAAVTKAAEGKKGTEQKGQGTAAPSATTAPPPFETSRFAVALVKLIAAGGTDVGNPTLENFRAIAKLVTSNPEAFAEV